MQGNSVQGKTHGDQLPQQFFSEITQLLDQLDARPRPTHSSHGLAHRGLLGDFTSVVCFKALMRGLEDILGEQASRIVFVRAGRLRGQQLVEDWGVGHLTLEPEKMAHLLEAALGKNGTRLCSVRELRLQDEQVVVNTQETICSAEEALGSSRRCTFTLGAVWGALETLTGQQYEATQTQSVLAGDPYDQFTFTPLHQ